MLLFVLSCSASFFSSSVMTGQPAKSKQHHMSHIQLKPSYVISDSQSHGLTVTEGQTGGRARVQLCCCDLCHHHTARIFFLSFPPLPELPLNVLFITWLCNKGLFHNVESFWVSSLVMKALYFFLPGQVAEGQIKWNLSSMCCAWLETCVWPTNT